MSLKQLFLIYFRIGALTFGGGYAMIPVIERTLVDKTRWLSRSDFYDALIICQSLPGVIAINFAVYLGYQMRGWKGALVSALGVALPSFLMIILFAALLFDFVDHPMVARVFQGLRVSVVALIFTASYRIYKQNQGLRPLIIAAIVWVVLILGLHPFAVILGFATLSVVWLRLTREVSRDFT